MRWSAEKLRWLALGGVLLLAGVIAAFFGLAKYTRGRVWQRILARNGVNLVQETDSITYSQSDGKRTVFTLHASKSVPHGNGQYTLRNAVLILYGKDGRNDRISGSEFEYDQKAGVLRAIGEVHMDLEAPQTVGQKKAAPLNLSFTPDADTETASLIHVKTSGLVYVRKLGVAATKEAAEFRYQGFTCTSRGAEFDSGHNVLRLLADVRLAGKLREAPFTLTADKADLDRTAETVNLERPSVVSADRSARAQHAVLHLLRDGNLQAGDADGGVEVVSGTQSLKAPQLHGDFGTENRLHGALFSGGVRFMDSDAARPAEGSAATLALGMTLQGELNDAVANGGVALQVKDAASQARREMHARTARAAFVAAGPAAKRSVLRTLRLTGTAQFLAESPGKTRDPQPATTRVSADDLTTTFVTVASGRAEPQRLLAAGHTELQQSAGQGEHQESTGDALDVSFAQRAGRGAEPVVEVSSAVQTGHVVLHAWPALKAGAATGPPSVGRAQEATFHGDDGTLTLTGAGDLRAEVDDGETQLQAPKIVLHQGSGDGEATGGVTATSGGAAGSAANHVLAARAVLLHGAGMSEFYGTDAQPAQLWQGSSQVRAAKLVLDGQHHTLSARPEGAGGAVSAVFANARGAGAQPERAGGVRGASGSKAPEREGATRLVGGNMPEASRDAVQVRAAAMDYNDAQHEATFDGAVTLRDPAGLITGKHAAAFLQAPAAKAGAAPAAKGQAVAGLGGRLERLVVIGDVRLTQPGRTGTGEQLTYTAPSNSFVLTGTAAEPPRIRDAQQGTITGATLLFKASDSSIVVAGAHAGGDQSKPTRVHTETDIKQ